MFQPTYSLLIAVAAKAFWSSKKLINYETILTNTY